MAQQLFKSTGDLEISASKTSSQHDFDFLIGKWRIRNRKLKTRLNNCNEWVEFEATGELFKILNGFGNFDRYRSTIDDADFEGVSLRLFNPMTRLWSIYWADSNVVVLDVPQVGSFDADIGRFYARDVYQSKAIIVLFVWDKTNPELPIWSQAFSTDNGETWEWNWYMHFRRE